MMDDRAMQARQEYEAYQYELRREEQKHLERLQYEDAIRESVLADILQATFCEPEDTE